MNILLHNFVVLCGLITLSGILLGGIFRDSFMKFINTKFEPYNNCYINSSTPFESIDGNCSVTGWVMNIIINETNETKYATACVSNHVEKKLKGNALCESYKIYPYERILRLGNKPMYYCSECESCNVYNSTN